MAIAILSQGVFDFEPAAPTYTQSFAVPAGTDMLLVLPTTRQISGATGAPTITLLSYDGVAMTAGFNNYAAGGTGDINSLIGYLRNPSIGTFDVVMNSSNTAGGAVWMLALSGVKATGTPVGTTAAQKISASGATSVGLGLTPSFAGSLLLTALGSGANTGTVTSFTGTGFTETITGRYGNNGDMPYTARHRLNVPATATTVSASFSLASPNCGGVFAEILAEASTTTDVAGTADATVAVAGSISSGLAQAEILNAGFRQLSAWTEILSLQADAAGVDRRIISAGVLGTPTLTLDQLLANKNYSWGYRLSDGDVRVDSGTNTQSLLPQHLALIHHGAAGQAILLNGVPTGGTVAGAGLSGSLVLPTGGERIGSHGSISPAPYTGLIGRYLLYGQAMSVEQVRLLALSETDPDALWGVGSEDDAQVSNQSLVACPLHSELDGQATIEIIPVILDPSGGALTVTAVTQPANGTLAISGLRLVYNPTRGWQGADSATYTASDGIKSSTGKLTFRQTRPALKCTNDTTTVAPLGSVIFDPRSNDVGAGPLTIVSYSSPSKGVVTTETDGRSKYVNQTGGTTDSFSYTVQDAYSSQSATVSVTITAGSFLVAGDVAASTTQDKFVDIDVVAAASASADLTPIVVKSGSITTPTLGTATLQADGKIRYTPETGESGYTDQFDFVLKPSAAATPTDLGTVSVQVQAITTGRPKDPDLSGRTVLAATKDNFSTIYNSAKAGEVIECADGTYTGTYTLSRSFTTDNPVIIKSKNTHGAVFSGTIDNHDGIGHWFHRLKFTRFGSTADDGALVMGRWSIATKNWFTGQNVLTVHANRGGYRPMHHVWIGWNRFATSGDGATVTHIKFNKSDSGPSPGADKMEFSSCYVYRNFFSNSGSPNTQQDPIYHIYIGNTQVLGSDLPFFDPFIIEENYAASGSATTRFLYTKNGITGVYRNRWLRNGGTPMSQRHGWGTQWWGNRVAGGSWEMGGGGTAALFTDMRRNVGGTINLGWGHSATGTITNSHQAADYYLLYANNCNVNLGTGGGQIYTDGGGLLDHVRIYNHLGGTPSINTTTCDEGTFTIVTGNPLNLPNPPVVNGVTDANGTVLTTFGPSDVGMETASQS